MREDICLLHCSRVGGGALTRWPPSAAQSARAGFPNAAFAKAQPRRDGSEGIKSSKPNQLVLAVKLGQRQLHPASVADLSHMSIRSLPVRHITVSWLAKSNLFASPNVLGHPRRPTPPASEVLVGAGTAGRYCRLATNAAQAAVMSITTPHYPNPLDFRP